MRGPRLRLSSKTRGHYFSEGVRRRLLRMADGLERCGRIAQAEGLRAKVREARVKTMRRRAKNPPPSFKEYHRCR